MVRCMIVAWVALVVSSLAAGAISAPTTRMAALIEEIVPVNALVRAPYEPARYDPGIRSGKGGSSDVAQMRALATARQTRMEVAWKGVSALKPESLDAEAKAQFQLLSYAFGQGNFADAASAARTAGVGARLRWARLLLAECRFDEAIGELAELADATGPVGEQALATLVAHAVQRRCLAQQVQLLPLALDLDAWLQKRAGDPKIAAMIGVLRLAAEPPVTPETEFAPAGSTSDSTRDLALDRFFEPQFSDLDRFLLQRANGELLMFLNGPTLLGSTTADLRLVSVFCGPIEFRLYRWTDREKWDKVSAADLPALKPIRQFTKTFHPLRDNNQLPTYDEQLAVDGLGEGWYLLTCRAPYAPMIAGQKFCVGGRAAYLRTGRNLAVATLVDRGTGAPVANSPVTLEVQAVVDAGYAEKQAKPEQPRAFQLGLSNAKSATAEPALAPAVQVAWAKSYLQGQELRRKFPDIRQSFHGTTGADGCAAFPLAIGRPEYAYRIRAQGDGIVAPEAECAYFEPAVERIDVTQTLVWTAQPVYRPGDAVPFAGVIRRFDGLRVAAHDPAWRSAVDVELKSESTVLWKDRLQLSPGGVFNGDLKLPRDAALGRYSFWVDGAAAQPDGAVAVQEFRSPRFATRLSLDQQTLVGGERATGAVRVGYCFSAGKNGPKGVADAAVEIVLETGEKNPPSVMAVTDASGVAKFELPVPAVNADTFYSFRATVMDLSGESYNSTRYVSVKASPFALTVETTPCPIYAGTEAKLRIKASTWDGKPVANATVAAYGGGTREAGKTGADGEALLPLRVPKEPAKQSINIVAIDGPRVAHASIAVEVLARPETKEAQEPPASDRRHTNTLQAYADKSVDVGADLPITVDLDDVNDRECTVLLFVENSRILAHRSLRLRPGRHTVVIPTNADFTPSVRITAITRIHGGSQSADCTAYVRPTARFLTLEIATDKEIYRPGQACVAQVRATDRAGKPVANAEISLGVVNDALYSLRADPTPDIADFFYRYEVPALPGGAFNSAGPACPPLTYWAGPKYAWGYLSTTVDAKGVLAPFGIPGGAFGGYGGRSSFIGMGGAARPSALRRDFRHTAHWVANLVTDRDGLARVRFNFPDDITSWRFTARGLTADTRVGQVRLAKQTFLPLQVELALPRFIHDGDRATVRAVIHNNADADRSTSVRCETPGGQRDSALALKSQADAFVEIPLAVSGLAPITLRARVEDVAGADGDATERTLAVRPRGYRFERHFAGAIREPAPIMLDLPGRAVPGTLRLTVNLESGIAGAIASTIDQLIEYPYGCVEQTMSRFMPAVAAAGAMRAANLPNPNEKKLADVLEQSLAKLVGYQHADGGWGWWDKDASNDFMTAHVLEGLALCKLAGREVPLRNMESAERYLRDRYVNNKLVADRAVGGVGACDIRLYAAHAMMLYYSLDRTDRAPDFAAILAQLPSRAADGKPLTNRDAALRIDTLRLAGQKDQALVELNQIVPGFQLAAARADILAAATLLEAGVALDPVNPAWQGMARRLIALRRGAGWTDTLTSAAAVRGLASLLVAVPETPGVVDILADDKVIASASIERGRSTSISLSSEISGARRIFIRPRDAAVSGFWSARLEAVLVDRPPAPANPVSSLACRFARILPQRVDIPAAQDRLAVRRAQTIEVRMDCELSQPIDYFRVSFRKPAGVELVRPPKLESGIVAYEDRDDAVHLFVDSWPPGRHTVAFLVRAEIAGQLFAPPPELQPMYDNPLPITLDAPGLWEVEK